MNDHKLLTEAILVHLLAGWGIRTLMSQGASVLHVFDANTPAWFAIRLARAGLAVAVVLVWARWRKIVWQDISLGGQYFWRNFGIAFGAVAVLWLIVVRFSGNPLEAPNPISYGARIVAVVTAFVDVLAQQLPTFGLFQGLGMKHGKTAIALGWVFIHPAHPGLAHLGRFVPLVQAVVREAGNIHVTQGIQETVQDLLQTQDDLGEVGQRATTIQILGSVNDDLNAQDAFAFGIHLGRDLPEMEFEDRQVIHRFLDHDFTAGFLFGACNGLDVFWFRRWSSRF